MATVCTKNPCSAIDGSKCSERAFAEAATLAKQCDAKAVGLCTVLHN